MQPPWRHASSAALRGIAEQLSRLLGHRARQLLGIRDGHGAAVISRDIMADADGDQLHSRPSRGIRPNSHVYMRGPVIYNSRMIEVRQTAIFREWIEGLADRMHGSPSGS
jgi:hypothetical protein